MHEFKYKNNELYCENIKISDIVKNIPTPFYLYSYRTLINHYDKLATALKGLDPLICFSVKSNSNISVLRALVKRGAGLDIVSGGELYRARLAGVKAKKVVYAGVGKRSDEIEDAIRFGVMFFNVESVPELGNINRIAEKLGRKVNAALRINPDVSADTHAYITTGKIENKFGLDFGTAKAIFEVKDNYPNVSIRGIHIHIGSQITSAGPFVAAIKKVLQFIKKNKIGIEYLNIGGGLGIVYSFEKPQTARQFAGQIIPILKKSGLKIILEPGRFISGNSGVMVTRIVYVKKAPRKKFIIVDSGMNDLIRPSLYGAYHEILPLDRAPKGKVGTGIYDVVGPICESGDFFGKDRVFFLPIEGDVLAVMSAGAYGFAMSGNYNSRPRPAEVMVIGGRYFVVRKKESYKDLVKGEVIPGILR